MLWASVGPGWYDKARRVLTGALMEEVWTLDSGDEHDSIYRQVGDDTTGERRREVGHRGTVWEIVGAK